MDSAVAYWCRFSARQRLTTPPAQVWWPNANGLAGSLWNCCSGFEPRWSPQLETEMEYFKKTLPDGREVAVWPLTFGRARLVVGNEYHPRVDYSYEDAW